MDMMGQRRRVVLVRECTEMIRRDTALAAGGTVVTLIAAANSGPGAVVAAIGGITAISYGVGALIQDNRRRDALRRRRTH
jgi:hypothetical protein